MTNLAFCEATVRPFQLAACDEPNSLQFRILAKSAPTRVASGDVAVVPPTLEFLEDRDSQAT